MANPRLCSIPDCDKAAVSRGWCRNHYARWFRTGSTAGSNYGEPLKFINDVALPYAGDDCLTWPFSRVQYGYGRVWQAGKMLRAHRLICELAHGSPPAKHLAAHSCGNGHLGCVNPRHLRWATYKENGADAAEHGRTSRGQKNPTAILSEAQVREIRSLKGKRTIKAIAASFGVSHQLISAIHTGAAWGWLE